MEAKPSRLEVVRERHARLREAWASSRTGDGDVYSVWLCEFTACPGVVFETINIGPSSQPGAAALRGEICRPDGFSGSRTVLYLHGGGFRAGSASAYRALTSRIAALADAEVFAPDFRLAPKWRFPVPITDAVQAYEHLLGAGRDPQSIVIAGDSTGGGQVLSTLLTLRELRLPMPAGAVCLSPFVDLAVTGESSKDNESVDTVLSRAGLEASAESYLASGEDVRHPIASPLYGDLRGLPPLLIHVGDTEVLLDDSTRLAEKAKACGVDVTCRVWRDMPHVFQLFNIELPEAREALAEIAEFVRRRTSARVSAS